MAYLLDTSIIIAILKGNAKVKNKLVKCILSGEKICINAISYYGIKRGALSSVNSIKELEKFEKFIKEFSVDVVLLDNLNIFDKASEIYAELRNKGKLISDADILIASIAIFHNFTLVSDDTDFNRISGLKIENWLL
jgi:tRNA(fMet)-specific endonuclease VapC